MGYNLKMLPQWVVLAILAGLASNFFNFINRYVLKEEGDPTAWAFFFEFVRLIVFTIVLFFDFSIKLEFKSFILLFLVGFTEFVSVYLYMQMHKFSHLSISTIISRTRLIWIPIIAFLFFAEKLKLSEYLGIAILFLGLSIVVSPHKLFVDKGAVYANLAAFVIAINTIMFKLSIPYASNSLILVAFCLPSVIFFPLLMKNAKKRILGEARKNFPIKLAGILGSVVSSYLLVWALHSGDVSRVNAIYQGMLIVSVLAGIIILKERKNLLRKLLGSVVTIIGVILLT